MFWCFGVFADDLFGESDVNSTVEGHSEGIEEFDAVGWAEREAGAENEAKIHLEGWVFGDVVLEEYGEGNALVGGAWDVSDSFLDAVRWPVVDDAWGDEFAVLVIVIVVGVVVDDFFGLHNGEAGP